MATQRISQRATWMTGVALLALWGISFGLSYASLGRAALPVALTIAGAKALLVLLVFMELLVAPLSTRLAIGAALSMIALLVALMAADVATRAAPPLLPFSQDRAAR
jgi:cytochrome c oxidase subunit IV